MGRPLALALLLVLAGLYGTAHANSTPKWPLEKLADRAELVFVGSASGAASPSEFPGLATIEIRPRVALKGELLPSVHLYFNIGGEFKTKCCDAGTDYVFFLYKTKRGFWYPVNAPHGVVPVPPQ